MTVQSSSFRVLFLAIFVITGATGFGLAYEKTYWFELVNWPDQTLNLQEPERRIPLKISSPDALDEEALDRMYQNSVLPELERERADLRSRLLSIDARLSDGSLDDTAVRSLLNEAHDDYHRSVSRISIIASCWQDCDHQSFASALAKSSLGITSTVGKDWARTQTESRSTKKTTQQGSTTTTEYQQTTRTTSTSFGVAVDPAGAVMHLSSLFAKKRKQAAEPTYFPAVRAAIDATNGLGDLAEKDWKTVGRLQKAVKPLLAGGSEAEQPKARQAMPPILDALSASNGEIRRQAAALRDQLEKALAGGAKDDAHIADTLGKMSTASLPMGDASAAVDRALAGLRGPAGGTDDFQSRLQALLDAVQARDDVVDLLHNLGYLASRDIEY
jgi:hypothetical protein